MTMISKEMILVCVQNVAEDDLIRVEFFRLLLLFLVIALVGNMFIMVTLPLSRNDELKKAESLYQ